MFTNFGGFPKTMSIIRLFYIKEICSYSINKLIFYKWLMCTFTIHFMKNLWDNLNLVKLICEYIFIFLRIMNGLFCEHIDYVLKTYDKS